MNTRKLLLGLFLLPLLLLLADVHVALGGAPGEGKWGITLQFDPYVLNDVALAKDGTLYVSSYNGFLYSVNQNATLNWAYNTLDIISTPPAIWYSSDNQNSQYNGRVYVGLTDGRVLCIGPSGNLKWTYYAGCVIRGAPAFAKDGTIYVGTQNSKLVALNPDGSEKWVFETYDEAFLRDPVVGPDGTIYFGTTWEKMFYAVNPDGSVKWWCQLADDVTTSPAIGKDGTLYVGTNWGLYAIFSWGAVKWFEPMWGEVYSSPAIGPDGTLYVGAGGLVAIDPDDGSEKWFFMYNGTIPTVGRSSPAVDSNGTIYFGSFDETLYAIHPDGSFYWGVMPGGTIGSSPIIDDEGTLYFCSRSSAYAYYTGSSGPALTTWPMGRHGVTRNGRLDSFWLFKIALKDLLYHVHLIPLDKGTERSLAAKLDAAVQLIEKRRMTPARNQVGTFIRQVEALTGKKLGGRDAEALIQYAQDILDGDSRPSGGD